MLRQYSTEITTLCTVALVAIGILGFGATIWQLNVTQRALKASNAYQIQKDARALATEIYAEGLVRKTISGEELNPEEEQRLHNHLWRMFNFYLAVYRQKQGSGIGDDFSESFSRDFCGLLQQPAISNRWQGMVEDENLSEDHLTMMENWCAETV